MCEMKGGTSCQAREEVTIQVPDAVVDYLQTLDYELAGLRVLHTYALDAGIAKAKTDEIYRRFQEKFAEYEVAKQEMISAYAEEVAGRNWRLDYLEGVLHIA